MAQPQATAAPLPVPRENRQRSPNRTAVGRRRGARPVKPAPANRVGGVMRLVRGAFDDRPKVLHHHADTLGHEFRLQLGEVGLTRLPLRIG